jgi:Holliday junction resolvase RusA-like endonuclease
MLTGHRLALVVHGTPIPQGSKTVVPARGNRRAFVRDANAQKLQPWRDKVREVAEQEMAHNETLTGPVKVWIRFTFERPASHYRTGANSRLLKDDAPLYPLGGSNGGDIDKLQRSCFDALTDAHVWADDKLAVDVRARKFWSGEHEYALDRAGVAIIVEPLSDQGALL